MIWTSARVLACLEASVVLFQVWGVVSLCMSRLMPATRWETGGRVGFVLALIGLGVAGALCGRHDSEFALFAGGSMTLLLIGMIAGGGTTDPTAPTRALGKAKPGLVS